MIRLLNYSHPLTEAQLAQLTVLLGETPTLSDIDSQVDRGRALVEAVRDLVDAAGLTAQEWQTIPLVLNPPALAPVALTMLAEIHGRCGYFPPILNIRPVADAVPPRYELAEIVNLQALRDQARGRRHT